MLLAATQNSQRAKAQALSKARALPWAVAGPAGAVRGRPARRSRRAACAQRKPSGSALVLCAWGDHRLTVTRGPGPHLIAERSRIREYRNAQPRPRWPHRYRHRFRYRSEASPTPCAVRRRRIPDTRPDVGLGVRRSPPCAVWRRGRAVRVVLVARCANTHQVMHQTLRLRYRIASACTLQPCSVFSLSSAVSDLPLARRLIRVAISDNCSLLLRNRESRTAKQRTETAPARRGPQTPPQTPEP